jgi:hypothetical protein
MLLGVACLLCFVDFVYHCHLTVAKCTFLSSCSTFLGILHYNSKTSELWSLVQYCKTDY